MTELEALNKHRDISKRLAEEYKESYNNDKSRIALNQFYHSVISYNNYESVIAEIENREAMILCFGSPPKLTEKVVEVPINRLKEIEKENGKLKDLLERSNIRLEHLQKENNHLHQQVEELKKENELLKEQKQWHDLRINPNDLPPLEKDYSRVKSYFSVDVLNDKQESCYYHYKTKIWMDAYSHDMIDTPKAWCEIPKFEELAE